MRVTTDAPDGFKPACVSPNPDGAFWVVFRGDELVVDARTSRKTLLSDHPIVKTLSPLHGLGTLDTRPVVLAEISSTENLPDGLNVENMRAVFAMLSPAQQACVAYGSQIRHWDKTTRFCGTCGVATVPSSDSTRRAKHCPQCAHEWFPRVSPCTITLVHDDNNRVLLTRQATWPKGRYGLVAGFVEPGETLEDCVKREALEEAGIELTEVTYAGSQPWPFPHQIMVGFTARWVRGEAFPQDGELEDVRWFSKDELPILPPQFSIARRLIDAFYAR
jgi:NAD+ diphosphatase